MKLQLKLEWNAFPGNKTYHKEIKPYFNDKECMLNEITLVEKDKIVHKDKKTAKKQKKNIKNSIL